MATAVSYGRKLGAGIIRLTSPNSLSTITSLSLPLVIIHCNKPLISMHSVTLTRIEPLFLSLVSYRIRLLKFAKNLLQQNKIASSWHKQDRLLGQAGQVNICTHFNCHYFCCSHWQNYQDKTEQTGPGPYSKHFIFFITYEWAH